jgi:hypothetical protein
VLNFLDGAVRPVADDWLEELVRWAERPGAGVVGGMILDARGRVVQAGNVLRAHGAVVPLFQCANERQSGPFGNVSWYRNFQVVGLLCLALRRAMFEAAGGFDETQPGMPGRVALFLRARDLGYRNRCTPYARLRASRPGRPAETVHFVLEQTSGRGTHLGWSLDELADPTDPYDNPNLSRTHRMPTVATPGAGGDM